MSSSSSGKPGATGIRRIFNATGYSWQGLKAAFQHEAAIRQELVLLLVAAGILSVVDLPLIERLLMFASVVLVLIVELINSAIEAVVDRVGAERHELSGRAKDIGSAAVMVSLLLAGLIWGSLLYAYYG
ncbi:MULTISPECIES: diacylglycerol kinase [Vibrio]|uniref:diacylglycerol kinase n=1 Tax=Vibrio TaxID=662 RepID=UPI00137333BE|nr:MULTISPECIES: diacylglycerol kinase [unclassified Vibrio]NAW70318.1 diacylglycerol kinase [Vibrio sp. V28_P6S34P95]NAX06072.1 diacylglycerol kinase [Vibrio sp. V30_P3S12P165]NAX35672.1 diacylglycerol kinase [Vibrio sp. V29_P1S30P107]NAX36271.1 diacylglycerol kinase [Vibrio sp. V27_P1S3P104]NAX39314.1 diacylglycerol kinase [Vibrio sp. V26_P1S5P106]